MVGIPKVSEDPENYFTPEKGKEYWLGYQSTRGHPYDSHSVHGVFVGWSVSRALFWALGKDGKIERYLSSFNEKDGCPLVWIGEPDGPWEPVPKVSFAGHWDEEYLRPEAKKIIAELRAAKPGWFERTALAS